MIDGMVEPTVLKSQEYLGVPEIDSGAEIQQIFAAAPDDAEWSQMDEGQRRDWLFGVWAQAYMAADADPEAVRAALWPYLFRTDAVGQTASDMIVSLSQLRVTDCPVTETGGRRSLRYYGNEFNISGLEDGEYNVFEINVGLVVVERVARAGGSQETREPVGYLKLHPYYFDPQKRKHDVEVSGLETLFPEELNDDRMVDPASLKMFLTEHNDYFDDDGGLNIYWKFRESFNIIPLSAKYEFWQVFNQCTEEEKARMVDFVGVYGKLGLAFFAALDGRQDALAWVDFGLEALKKDNEAGVMFTSFMTSQAYLFEAFPCQMAVAANGEEEMLFLAKKLVGQSRGVVAEVARALRQSESLNQEEMAYFENAFGGLEQAYYILSQLNQGEKAAGAVIPFDLIEASARVRAGLPGARESFRAVLLYFTAQAYANQQGVTPAQVAKFVDGMYEGTPDLFEAATETTADTLRERERNWVAVQRLRETGLAPVEREVRLADYGSGPGWRLMYDLYQRMAGAGAGVEITGFDFRQIDNPMPHMEVVKVDMRRLGREWWGRADVGVENWSSAFDWWELSGQDRMLFHYVMGLRPPQRPRPLAQIRNMEGQDIVGMAEEDKAGLGGVLMIDRAVPWGEASHRPAMREYHRTHPRAVPGEKAPLGHYREAFGGQDVPDSLIDELFRYLALAQELGVVWLNLPNDEAELQRLKEEVLARDWSKVSDAELNDPFRQPFWRTANGFLKVTAIGVRVGNAAETTHPVLRPLVRSAD